PPGAPPRRRGRRASIVCAPAPRIRGRTLTRRRLMQLSRLMSFTGLGLVLLAGAARAETKVELKGTHLCCGNCVKAANEILKSVDGVKGTCDQKAGTITIVATD